MSGRRQTQQNLSQTLSLLESTNYQYPEATRSNDDRRTHTARVDIRLLDTIALCIATGKPGDVVASALDSKEKTIYLSRNGEPSEKDISIARDFLDTLRASQNETVLDILPWISSHSMRMVQRRIDKLRDLINKDKNKFLRETLDFQISRYRISVGRGIKAEFTNHASDIYLKSEGFDTQEIDSSTVQAILAGILEKFDAGLSFNAEPSSHLKFEALVFAATTLRESAFLNNLAENIGTSPAPEKLSKFVRNVNKVGQYIRIIDLIRYIKRKGPFEIQWVNKINMGDTLCYEFQELELQSASTTAIGMAKLLKLIELTPQRLEKCFHMLKPFSNSAERENPLKNRHVNTYVHAELKLIVFLLSRTPKRSQDKEIEHRPIGCSKRSCLYCTLWIQQLEEILNPTVHRFIYYTAGSHGHPYATCARVGPFQMDSVGLCSDNVERKLVELTSQRVKQLPTLKQGHIKNKDSEDHASASEDDEDAKRFSVAICDQGMPGQSGDWVGIAYTK